MDLMGYVILGNVLVFYLWSFQSDRAGPWPPRVCCLDSAPGARVPDAVYIALIVLPLEIHRLWQSPRKLACIGHLLWLTVPAATVAGIFVITNYRFLHWYYGVMNIDVLAHLPLARSLLHWEYLFGDRIGTSVCCVLFIWFSIRGHQAVRDSRRTHAWPQPNWRALGAALCRSATSF